MEQTTDIVNRTRIDREIQYNLLSFFEVYTKDYPLIINLFIYILDMQFKKTDMFHNFVIDLKAFAEQTGYESISNLNTVLKTEELEQFKKQRYLFENDETARELLFKTRFENCLYQLMSVNFVYSNFVHTKTMNYSVNKSESILEYARIFLKKNGKKISKTYHVKLSNRIIENLYNFYSTFNNEVFKKLDNKHKGLYLILCNINNSIKNNIENNYNYNYLMEAAGILQKEPKKQRLIFKEYVKRIKECDPDLMIDAEFIKVVNPDTQKPVLTVDGNVEYKIKFKKSEIINPSVVNDNFDYFKDYLEHKIFNYYYEKYQFYSFTKETTFDNESTDYKKLISLYNTWKNDKKNGALANKTDYQNIFDICKKTYLNFNSKITDSQTIDKNSYGIIKWFFNIQ